MKKINRFLFVFCSILFILLNVSLLVIFTTDFGYRLRVLAAETILSTQHRHWAKYTFLPDSELKELTYKIDKPKYLNSASGTEGKKLTKKEQIEKLKKSDLVVKVETIDVKESDHYYKGKLMTISNPFNVKLSTSKGQQVNSQFGEQINVIAERENAIAAVNASGFYDANGRGNGGVPVGIVIENGEIKNTVGGNNSKDYVAGLTDKGVMVSGFYSPNQLLDLNVEYAAGFKPQLIVNGKKMIKEGNGGWGYGPRTIMAQKKDGSIMFLVIDGRQAHSVGASLKDCQDLLLKRGAVNAMTMDGGSSSSMYLLNSHITTPSALGHIPRYLPNAWVIVPNEGQKVEVIHDNEKIK